MTTIVKRHGKTEEYDERKIYGSVYAAGLNVHLEEKEAEELADKVCSDVKDWLKEKKEVKSKDIFDKAILSLAKYNEDASFMYETHLDVS